jgi:hypothetical protein
MDKNGCPYFVPTFHGLTPERMVNIREKRPGLWEVRVFTDRDAAGKPVQESKTVRGTTKDAKRLAAQLTLRPASNATRRTVAELIGDYGQPSRSREADPRGSDREARCRSGVGARRRRVDSAHAPGRRRAHTAHGDLTRPSSPPRGPTNTNRKSHSTLMGPPGSDPGL